MNAMNRSAAFVVVAAVVGAAAGCGTGPVPAPPTEVTIYWEFDRNTFIDGVASFISYDTHVNRPGFGSGPCPQSGVSFVTVADRNGNQLSGAVPCVNQSVQGVVLAAFPGSGTYFVTGWREGGGIPLYLGQVTINAVTGAFNFGTVFASGIQDDLTVDAVLTDPFRNATCGVAGIDQLQGWIEDGHGSLVWRNSINCGPSFIPSIQFGQVDRDFLFLWFDTIDRRVSPPDIPWSRCDFGFAHFNPNIFSLQMELGACVPAPP
jgi:hypothetical protein